LCGQVLTPIEIQEAAGIIQQDLSMIEER
jgi:hypothetical protein